MKHDNANTEQLAEEIDQMSHYDMCRLWRFGSSTHGYRAEYFQGSLGQRFQARLFGYLGGFTPEISRQLGFGAS